MAPVTCSMAPTSFPTSAIRAKPGTTISNSRARRPPTRSSASATRRGCRRLPTSKPSGRSLRSGSSLREQCMGRVFVAGSINMDVVATADRHPKVGETVAGKQVLYFPGGKGANQAVAAARLGASTTLIGRLGKDSFGAELKTFLGAQGINLGSIKETAEAHSGTAIITVAQSDNGIHIIPGSNA